MKDAKGHGSDPRTSPGFAGRDVMGRTYSQAVNDHSRFPKQNPNMPDPENYKSAAHQTGVAQATDPSIIGHWQSAGGKWQAVLRAEPNGYHLQTMKNGNSVGASWRPDIKSNADALTHFDKHVRDTFDVGMKRVL